MAEGSAQGTGGAKREAGGGHGARDSSAAIQTPCQPKKGQISNSRRAGSSSASFMATRPSTASRPSMMRWS